MKLSRGAKFGLWALAAVVIGTAAYFVGTSLKPAKEPFYVFETDAPAHADPSNVAATSPGGFTGFGDADGGRTRVVIAGRVVEKTGDALTLEGTLGQRTLVRVGDSPRISRLDGGTADLLQPGATVAVRLNAAGDTVEAVLVLSQP
jgi:hypothetical protein